MKELLFVMGDIISIFSNPPFLNGATHDAADWHYDMFTAQQRIIVKVHLLHYKVSSQSISETR